MAGIDQLHYIQPNSGRFLKEDGSVVNFADLEDFYYKYNLTNQIINDGAALISARFNIPDNGKVVMVLDVPADRKVHFFFRSVNITEGVYHVDVIDVVSYGVEQQPGVLSIEAINQLNPISFDSTFLVDAANVVEGNVKEYGYLDTGSATGNRVAPSILTTNLAFKIYSNQIVGLRIDKQNAGAATAVFNGIVWEEAIS